MEEKNDKFTKNIITTITICVLFLFFALATLILYLIFSNMDQQNQFINGIFSFLGGVCGGALTLVGVRMTLTTQKRHAEEERILQELPTLLLIKYELNKVQEEIMTSMKLRNEQKVNMEKDGASEMELEAKLNEGLYAFSQRNWPDIHKILDLQLQADIIKFREFYNEFVIATTYDTHEIITAILHNDNDGFKLNRSIIELNNMVDKKRYFWDLFLTNDYQTQLENLIEKINDRLNKAEKVHS